MAGIRTKTFNFRVVSQHRPSLTRSYSSLLGLFPAHASLVVLTRRSSSTPLTFFWSQSDIALRHSRKLICELLTRINKSRTKRFQVSSRDGRVLLRSIEIFPSDRWWIGYEKSGFSNIRKYSLWLRRIFWYLVLFQNFSKGIYFNASRDLFSPILSLRIFWWKNIFHQRLSSNENLLVFQNFPKVWAIWWEIGSEIVLPNCMYLPRRCIWKKDARRKVYNKKNRSR